MEKIAVLIPCYNEEQTIGKVIQDFQKTLPEACIYVCDNNSNDETFIIAKNTGAIVLSEKKQGKGNAVMKMFREIDADIYIMIDGDDTYPIKHIHEMLKKFKNENAEILVGDRLSNMSYKKENKRRFHNFGNNLVRQLINSFFGTELNDILSGYRIFSKRFVKNYTGLIQGFELETDLSIFTLHYDLKIAEYPIDYQDRPEGSESKLNTFKDGFKVLKLFFNLIRLYKPLQFFGTLSAFFFTIGAILLWSPIKEYIDFQYIYKTPTLIVSMMFIMIGLLSFTTGIILDNISILDRKNFTSNYYQ